MKWAKNEPRWDKNGQKTSKKTYTSAVAEYHVVCFDALDGNAALDGDAALVKLFHGIVAEGLVEAAEDAVARLDECDAHAAAKTSVLTAEIIMNKVIH